MAVAYDTGAVTSAQVPEFPFELPKRKALGKKLRFEVFKRDGFQCQYCGATPPAVVLHVDHVIPVADGGKNHIDNLITACAPCNLGKGANSLLAIPQSLKDKAAEVAEREDQIRGYNEVLTARAERIEEEAWEVAAVLESNPWIENYDRASLQSIKKFLEKLPFPIVVEAAETALARGLFGKQKQFRYFCGICWSKIREVAQ